MNISDSGMSNVIMCINYNHSNNGQPPKVVDVTKPRFKDNALPLNALAVFIFRLLTLATRPLPEFRF